ncbi:MAG: LysE family transporter [Pseudomonadota bacterium]
MTVDIWIALAAANLVATAAPGQNVALVGSATVRGGMRGAGLAICGILLAEGLWSGVALALALGAREVSPTLFFGLQSASGIALLLFGLFALISIRTKDASEPPNKVTGRLAFEGLWIGLANPLALIFFISLFPAFVPDSVFSATPGVAAYYVSAILISSAAGLLPYAIAADALKRLGLGVLLNVISASTLTILGVILLCRVWH